MAATFFVTAGGLGGLVPRIGAMRDRVAAGAIGGMPTWNSATASGRRSTDLAEPKAVAPRVVRCHLPFAVLGATLAAAILGVAVPSARAQQNLLVNGDLESPVVGGLFTRFTAPSTAITGWNVAGGQVDLCSSALWQQVSGRNSLDLDGSNAPIGNGTIEQSFPTVAGQCYSVYFAFSGNPGGAPVIKTMRISAAGASADFTFDTSGSSFGNMRWTERQWSFVATSGATTLSFSSLTSPANFGPVIDNVRVFADLAITVQPQAATSCASGTAAFSIAGAGTGPTYLWQIETAPGVWQGLANDPAPLPCGGGASAYASPINSPSVQIGVHPCPGISRSQVRCIVSNVCGSATSNEATLTINSADFNGDGDIGTDADIEAFFACLAGTCCATCGSADFNGDGDIGTDADIEAFFRVLAGGNC